MVLKGISFNSPYNEGLRRCEKIAKPPGYRIALTVRGKDYEYPGGGGGWLATFFNEMKGCGPFVHDDPRDRPQAIFGGKNTIYAGGKSCSYVLLPIIPEREF